MRKLMTVLLGLGLATTALAQGSVDITGHWKEVRRANQKAEPMAYNDTLRIRFMIGNEYVWQQHGAYMYRGTYKIENGNLDLGTHVFRIRELTPNRVVFSDENFTYHMARYMPSPEQTDNRAMQKGDRYRGDQAGPVNLQQLPGKWQVYKRTAARQLSAVDYNRLIKTIDIPAAFPQKIGMLFASRDGDIPSWYVERAEGNVLYCKGRDERRITILRLTGQELILQEGDITYFLKQFR